MRCSNQPGGKGEERERERGRRIRKINFKLVLHASRSATSSPSSSPLSISEKCQVTDQTNRARWLPALLRLLPIRLIVSLQQLSV